MHVHIRIYIYIFVWPQRELEYMRIYMLGLVQQIVSHSCLPGYAAWRLWVYHVAGSREGSCVKMLLHSPQASQHFVPSTCPPFDSKMQKSVLFCIFAAERKTDVFWTLGSIVYCKLQTKGKDWNRGQFELGYQYKWNMSQFGHSHFIISCLNTEVKKWRIIGKPD